jgi:hypothetical protein
VCAAFFNSYQEAPPDMPDTDIIFWFGKYIATWRNALKEIKVL